ncbi:MAG: hypothetical protein HY879_21975 [Deltaproteobacteria bacterium]|nr:hypothetical protein [Deltaproteobacteria bacterium]
MKRMLILILLCPFILVTQSYGSDIETRLKALEEIIKNQQKTIDKQQLEINELKVQQIGVNLSQRAAKPEGTQPAIEETVGQTKSQTFGAAYPMNRIEKKFSEVPKTLEVYSFSQSRFVPDISFIVDGSFVARNLNDEAVTNLRVPELIPSGELDQKRGFNLKVGELSLYSPVDPFFDLTATIPFTEEGVELEEAYFATRSLPLGFQAKGGKFRSSFGRLNVQHEHAWDFTDAPLVNRAFFGEEGLIEKGVQFNWLAPTPFYLLLGTEILQGENTASFGTNGISLQKNDLTFSKDSVQQPNLWVAFIKSSFDLDKLSLLGGLSYAQGQTRKAFGDGSTTQLAFGDTKIYGLDLTAKYFVDSYRYVSWQNELMYRHMNLNVGNDSAPDDPTQSLSIFGKELKQSGFYSQLVYRFAKRWRIGARYDLLNQNDVIIGGVKQSLPGNLDRTSAMLEFRPTEFSTLRLQFNRDNSLFDGNNMREPVNSVFLQFNMAIGAHGAHAF